MGKRRGPYKVAKKRFSTPPHGICVGAAQKHLETPQRAAILTALYVTEQLGHPIKFDGLKKLLGVPSSTAEDVLQSGEARTFHNREDTFDPRGRPRQLTGSQANQIADYLDSCSFEQKAQSWGDLQIAADVPMVPGKEEQETYCRGTILH